MSDLIGVQDALRKRKPSRDYIGEYIRKCTGRTIPSRAVCKGHSAPLDFVKEFMFGDSDILVLANRSGGKTATSGMATGLVAYHDHIPVKILGGSGEQSLRMYEETKWLLEQGYEDRLSDDILKTEAPFKGGHKISIMTQSMKSVRGPHVPLVIYDEIDEFEQDVFDAGMSIPKTDPKKDFASKMVMQSTRHYPGGIMSKEWKKADDDRKRFVWCIWEIIESCDDRYKCTTCALTSAECPGKKALKDADGYFSVRDTIKMYKRLSPDSWNSEWLCTAPRKSGMVYENFDRRAVGKKRWLWSPRIPIWRSCDYGIDNQTVIQYWQVDGSGRGWLFYEMRWSGTAPSVIAKEMLAEENRHGWKKFDGTIVDPTAAGFRKELETIGKKYPKERGLRTCILAVNDRDPGVTKVRDKLVLRDDDMPSIMIDPLYAKETIDEMEAWKLQNGVPVKVNDHGCDALRYFVMTCPLMGGKMRKLGFTNLGVIY